MQRKGKLHMREMQPFNELLIYIAKKHKYLLLWKKRT